MELVDEKKRLQVKPLQEVTRASIAPLSALALEIFIDKQWNVVRQGAELRLAC